jgi:hypothetical protein
MALFLNRGGTYAFNRGHQGRWPRLNCVLQEFSGTLTHLASVEEPEPRQVARQVLRCDPFKGVEPPLYATVQCVDVLKVVRPKLVRASWNLAQRHAKPFARWLVDSRRVRAKYSV